MIVAFAGLTVTATGGLATLSQTAVTTAVPFAIAVTKPEVDIEAMSGVLEFHDVAVQVAVVESLKVSVAMSAEVSPTVSAREPGVTMTEATVGFVALTVTATGALAMLLQVTDTTVVPFAIAVMRPEPETEALEGMLELQVVVHADVVASLYVAVATSWEVSPTVRVRADGVIETEVMIGLGGLTVMTAGALLTLLQTAVTEAVPLAIAVTAPPPETDAMRGWMDVQVV